MVEEIKGDLITIETLKEDFKSLGITPNMTLILHSSLKSLGGWIAGGATAVILALEDVIGKNGTLVMPTHSGDLSDPEEWENPPVNESWWIPIKETMPAYDRDLTPTSWMGIIPECFRKQRGVIRSNHPQVSFAAWGAHAAEITSSHSLEFSLGENSPLASIYDLNGWILLLGVGNSKNTSIHLAEYRADFASKREVVRGAPLEINGKREWVEFIDIDIDSSDFENIGNDFIENTNFVRRGKVANANALLIPQRKLVDYSVDWISKNRK
jgi:aminoglycoside 3-N-acetyltransferase